MLKIDFRDAFLCLWEQKARTLLSMLGMAIGTTALVSMLSIGEGARYEIEQQIASLGIDVIRIENKFTELAESNHKVLNLAKGISEQDALIIEKNYPEFLVGRFYRFTNMLVSSSSSSAETDLFYVNPDWISIDRLQIKEGRSITQSDIQSSNQVCIVGAKMAELIKITVSSALSFAKQNCVVIGIFSERGAMLVEGTALPPTDYDMLVVTPLISSYSNQGGLSALTVKVNTVEPMRILEYETALTRLLSAGRSVIDFQAVSPVTLLNKAQQERQTFSIVMGSIAGLSIIVGGIGVMNAMLAHVAEQTREIGLRIALGANQRRILQFFLCQSVIVCLVGTVVGIVIGVFFSLAVQYNVGWTVYFSLSALSTGPLISVLSGILFGLYPAFRATQITPNIALRIV